MKRMLKPEATGSDSLKLRISDTLKGRIVEAELSLMTIKRQVFYPLNNKKGGNKK